MRINNPILPGFHPDPSICRVGADFYVATSSFEYFPGVPLFRSRDLLHWEQLGHCLTRHSQLDLHNVPSSGGIWAPTIRHFGDTFYMAGTNMPHFGNFIVTTKNPADGWSDPIRVDQPGIDPSLLIDEDAIAYFTNASNTSQGVILQSEIDVCTGRRLTDIRPIWHGSGGRYTEGPHLYKIQGTYYLLTAEGGTEYGHMINVARSTSPWGPFEDCPTNPILSNRSYDSPIQCTGHGDLVEASDGRWWLVFLGARPHGQPPVHHLGRETFLAPVIWQDGWPVVLPDGHAHMSLDIGPVLTHPVPALTLSDDFDGEDLRLYWNFLRNPNPATWSVTERRGWLTLHGAAATLDEPLSPAFLGRRQEHFNCAVSTYLDFTPYDENEEAGLTVLMNERHHYEVAITHHHGQRWVVVRRRIGSLAAEVAQEPVDNGPIELRIDATRDLYRFSYKVTDGQLREIAEGETRYLASEVAGGFTGVYLGLYATGRGRSSSTPAHFDWFRYEPLT